MPTPKSLRSTPSLRKEPLGHNFKKKMLWGLLIFFGLGGCSGGWWLFDVSKDLPDVMVLKEFKEPQSTVILDRHGKLLGELFVERRKVIPFEQIPTRMLVSVLAAEDADFYAHKGMDQLGLLRAFVRGIMSGGNFRGTSTITQQLVKNLLLSNERSLKRKIKELILAKRIEAAFSKNEILWLYLNHINFGHGRYGVEEASSYYFGKHAKDLNLDEAALLAGLPQSPTHLSPREHPERALKRRAFILNQLREKQPTHWPSLNLEEITEAEHAPITLVPVSREQVAPELVGYIKKTLQPFVDEDTLLKGGYTIETTLDRAQQMAARKSIKEGLLGYETRQKLRSPFRKKLVGQRSLKHTARLLPGKFYDAEVTRVDTDLHTLLLNVEGHPAKVSWDGYREFLEMEPFAEVGARFRVFVESVQTIQGAEEIALRLEIGPEAAMIALDVATREVIALVGGRESSFGLNRALDMKRQPGSTFKPLVVAAALESLSVHAASRISDQEATLGDWSPHNFDGYVSKGVIPLREALEHSVNMVAAQLIAQMGPASVVSMAQRLGITSTLEPTLPLALGSSEVSLVEMVNAYAVFADHGQWKPWSIIRKVTGPDGKVLYERPHGDSRQAISEGLAYLMTDLLKGVVKRGTATAANSLNRMVAGKTGTTNESKDAWFVGYSPQMVCGVWVGYNETRTLGRRETGGRAALPIWMSWMKQALASEPNVDFDEPSGVVRQWIDPSTGEAVHASHPGAVQELFLSGTDPTALKK